MTRRRPLLGLLLALAAALGGWAPAEAARAGAACQAPEAVCAARAGVFRIASFDPFASAVLIAPGLLVTNRHVVADAPRATVHLPRGGTVEADVVATAYPGDLVLLRVKGLDRAPVLKPGQAGPGSRLYAIGADLALERIRVYPPGKVLFLPAPGKPLARLHSTAYSQAGNSGGALVDGKGRLVGIIASGGEGLNEAVPASDIARLKAQSGEKYAAASRALGKAYRLCTVALESARRGRPDPSRVDDIGKRCRETGNRQFLDLAAQALGRARRLDESAALFEKALEQDPDAINSRVGLAVTLTFARRYAAAVPHLEWLLDVRPADERVLRLAIQAGKWGGQRALAERALALLRKYHPDRVEAARRFLADDRPAPAPLPAPR